MTRFAGVLLKPLDQQHDRDDYLIDPAGVTFDPNEEIPIWRDFNYRVPEDMLGRGFVSRRDDGSLWVEGEIDLPESTLRKQDLPWRLAIGVITERDVKRRTGDTVERCRLFSVAFTANHQDPGQPVIEIKEGTQ